MNKITTHTREQRKLIDAMGPSIPFRTKEVPIATGHKFKVGDSVRLVGMQDYPEFNGEIVTIVAFREPGPHLGYYIESQNADLSDQLNFIYERRLILS